MVNKLKSSAMSLGSFLKATMSEWSEDNVTRLAATLAYFAVFSLAPLLVILVAVAGFVFGEQAVRGEIVHEIQGYVGQQSAEMIQGMIASASKHSAGVLATILAVAALLFGASGFFVQLQGALNTIWDVRRKQGGNVIIGFLQKRLFSTMMVLATGLLLVALLAGTSFLWTLTGYFKHLLPIPGIFWQGFDFLVSFVILILIFALVLKVVPDVKITWKDVSIGAVVTALLFTVGQFLLGLYLGRKSFTSTYGVAGSFVMILVWIYYSAQIFLFGAEITQVYAHRHGRKVQPADDAVPVRKSRGSRERKSA